MSTKTKPLTLADVIEGLEQVIEEWGEDAFGGDQFSDRDLDSGLTSTNAWGMPTYPELPVCAVATFAADYVDEDFNLYALSQKVGLTEEADAFLGHVIAGVDGQGFYNGKWVHPPANPRRDWRQGLDFALNLWGMK